METTTEPISIEHARAAHAGQRLTEKRSGRVHSADRIRLTARYLVGERGLDPEAVRPTLEQLAEELGVSAFGIDTGIAEGLAMREQEEDQ